MSKKVVALCILASCVFIYGCGSKEDNLDLQCVDGENCSQETQVQVDNGIRINENNLDETYDTPPVVKYESDGENSISGGGRESSTPEI